MRVLVDTSVWIDFVNGHPSPEADALARYLDSDADLATCGVIMAEFFQGLRRPDSVARLLPYFNSMVYLRPREPASYLAAADLFRGLRRQGVTIRSTIDCLILQLAEEHSAFVLAKDRDIQHILDSGLTRVTAAPLIG
jgi:predicted nucleic acid-binding protein